MLFRTAKKKDLKCILELYKQLNENEEMIRQNEAESIWALIRKNKFIKYFIAEENSKIISTCYIAIIPNLTRHGKSIGFIEKVITDKNYRKQGIGKRVIEQAIEYAKKCNCYKVLLQSNNKRKEAHLFYKSIGFDGNSKRAFEIRLK
jgi:GNAT superfamily N-acetyltransferase